MVSAIQIGRKAKFWFASASRTLANKEMFHTTTPKETALIPIQLKFVTNKPLRHRGLEPLLGSSFPKDWY